MNTKFSNLAHGIDNILLLQLEILNVHVELYINIYKNRHWKEPNKYSILKTVYFSNKYYKFLLKTFKEFANNYFIFYLIKIHSF